MTTRLSRMTAVVAAVGVAAVVTVTTPAGAIGLTSFSMSPTSGPAGTAVAVSGTGCAPGLLLSSSLDRVVVTVASVPSASAQLPVSSGGAWSGTVTIPANAASGPAVATALCFTDGLQSLLTIYTPKTFTVTVAGAPPTTTTTVPETTHPPQVTVPPVGGPTPTTGPGSAHTTQPVAGRPVASGPSAGPSAPGGGSSDPGSAGTDHAAPAGTRTASAAKHADAFSVAADLRSPSLAGNPHAGDHGLGWVGWLAIALLLAGLTAGSLLLLPYRHEDAPAET